jgi:hypothetical protein
MIESDGMAYELKAIENFKQVCYVEDKDGNEKLNPLTHALIHLGQLAGYATLTRTNAPTMFERITKLRVLMGPLMQNPDGTTHEITWEDVRTHTGLFTNSAPMTGTQFNARILEMVASRASTLIREQENPRGK